MPDEEVQELGREGVGMVRAWLEATTWMTLPFNAYEDGPRCKVPYIGGVKKFDLRGYFLGDKHHRRELTVECKRYTTPGGQSKEFQKFLAIAYSATLKNIRERGSWEEDFIWVTSHPFDLGKWPTLASFDEMKSALEDPDNAPLLGGEPIDEELARTVAGRIWLLVLNEKQLEVTLTTQELKQVMVALDREGTALWNP